MEPYDDLSKMMEKYLHTFYGWAATDKYAFLISHHHLMVIIGVREFIKEKWGKVKEKWNNGDKIGAIKEFKWIIAGTSVVTLKIVDINKELLKEFIKSSYKDSNIGSGGGGAF